MKKKIKKNENTDPYSSINRRLDALIRVILETLYEKNKKLNESERIRLLNSAGLTPTEIATILGKGGDPTTVSYALYTKLKPKKKAKRNQPKENNGGAKNE